MKLTQFPSINVSNLVSAFVGRSTMPKLLIAGAATAIATVSFTGGVTAQTPQDSPQLNLVDGGAIAQVQLKGNPRANSVLNVPNAPRSNASNSRSLASEINEETLRIETAENATLFIFDDDPLLENGFPAYGNSFITQGYIYRAGTLNGSNGVNEDGSPEFPERVLGTWVCRGWFVNEDGAVAESGALVITSQTFNFGEEFGNEMIVTDGFELAEVGVPVNRAITGGTGRFRRGLGQATQVFLGVNGTEGFNLRHEIVIEQPQH